MKNILTRIIIVFAALFMYSCQDVVDIPLNTEPPRLVIEASINWQKGTSGSNQTIKLTTTTDYYSTTIPVVSGATVFVKNSANVQFNFIETPNTGEYVCTNFVPVLNEVYTLNVVQNGQIYTASESLKSVARINNVTQEIQSGFGNNILKINAFFNDPANEENYYLFKYKFNKKPTPAYSTTDDKFFQGNTFFSVTFQKDTAPGDTVEITHFGISKEYYNYMNVLLAVAGSSNGGPFQTQPVKARGNIQNSSNPENYPFGYFRLSEMDSLTYTIQ